MSGGLLALLDDVVALTKVAAATIDDAIGQAAKAGTKAAGIVIDDAAVTPRYVVGFAASRELPIVGRIAYGSLKNKIVYLLPAALLLTAFAPWALTPILMIGGLYLCFEGYEKIHEMLLPHQAHGDATVAPPPAISAKEFEDAKVAGAIRTDVVLSAEIMALTLASLTAPDLVTQAIVLALVAVMVTGGVYGAVALIVKADDFGMYLALNGGPMTRRVGRMLVHGMPPFLKFLSIVGTLAMLWVGGGILVHGLKEYGITQPEDILHMLSEGVRNAVQPLGGVLAWLTTATGSAAIGLIAGGLTAVIINGVALPLVRVFKKAA